MPTIQFTVNGRAARADVRRIGAAGRLPARGRSALTGTHVGCEHGVCGACTVLVDGEAVRTCLMLAVQADGARGHDGRGPGRGRRRAASAAAGVHASSHGLQCGFCTPGMLMTAIDAAGATTRDPTEDEIRDGARRQPVPLHRLRRTSSPRCSRRRRRWLRERRNESSSLNLSCAGRAPGRSQAGPHPLGGSAAVLRGRGAVMSAGRFGSGQVGAAHRGRGAARRRAAGSPTTCRRAGADAIWRSCARRMRTRASSSIDADAARGDARRARGLHRRRARRGRRQADRRPRRLQARRRHADGDAAAPRAGARRGALRRRGGRRGRRRDAASRRATPPRRSWSTTRSCRRSSTPSRAIAPGAPVLVRRGARQHRRRDAPRRRRRGRGGVRGAPRTSSRSTSSTSASRRARSSRAAALAELDAASGRLTLRVEQPDADRRARRRCATRCSASRTEQVRVVVGDVGGGFGMKTGALSGGHRRRATPRARSKRPVHWQAERIEEFLAATHGRDVDEPRRAGARRRRQGPRAARALARQRRRLRDAGRRRRSSC